MPGCSNRGKKLPASPMRWWCQAGWGSILPLWYGNRIWGEQLGSRERYREDVDRAWEGPDVPCDVSLYCLAKIWTGFWISFSSHAQTGLATVRILEGLFTCVQLLQLGMKVTGSFFNCTLHLGKCLSQLSHPCPLLLWLSVLHRSLRNLPLN